MNSQSDIEKLSMKISKSKMPTITVRKFGVIKANKNENYF